MSIGRALLPLSLLIVVFPSVASGQEYLRAGPVSANILHHELEVELLPATHELLAHDRTVVEVPGQETATVAFSLASTLQVRSISLVNHSADGQPSDPTSLPFTSERPTPSAGQTIIVALPSSHNGRMTFLWTYTGAINDPPKESRHLRFVTPSETAGHIGLEGVYLSSESLWYPDIGGSLSSFHLVTKIPSDWTVVTQGRKNHEAIHHGSKISTWVVQDRSEALTLVANRFVSKVRTWKGGNGQQVELSTYFFPDNADLADEYLEASAKYLDAYVPLLGNYPFDKFAVVENFFPSGLGMPSFTLLGSGSIKRHYVQSYALGHEIVHSWIGNSVFNRTEHGNWVEGLTTYLANYYWHELRDDAKQAREQRRLMMQAYSLYVSPAQDYPVAQFIRKSDEKDNAIGYQKAAFIFHMLRREIGDDSFWRGLKTFVRLFQNRPADWGNLERVFSQESSQDLRWFFAQWVEQAGAPVLTVGKALAWRESGEGTQDAWHATIRVHQGTKPFRLVVPVEIIMQQAAEIRWLPVSQSEDTIELVLPARPLRVELDPDLMVFRRLERDHLPPMLNVFVTDSTRTVVQAFSDEGSPLRQVVTRMIDQDASLPEAGRAVIVSEAGTIPMIGSVLVLAGVEQHGAVQSLIQESCGEHVKIGNSGIRIDGEVYEGPEMAVLVSCHRAAVPGSVITVLYGITPHAVAKVSRLLFYYGWHSAVVFRDGVVLKRELWQSGPDMKEVLIDASR